MSNAANGCGQPQAKFPLGQIVATPHALTAIHPEEILKVLSRHVRGDWGHAGRGRFERQRKRIAFRRAFIFLVSLKPRRKVLDHHRMRPLGYDRAVAGGLLNENMDRLQRASFKARL